MHDELARFNQARWNALADAGAVFSRPLFDLDAAAARRLLDPRGELGSVAGARVLCLASGGGQQSAAFALLGAEVTVLDLAENQLRRDLEAAAQLGVTIRVEHGDMRDLSRFDADSFDTVWQPPSINYVPDARGVFGEVARVIRHGGHYHLDFINPLIVGIDERDWTGDAYPLRLRYLDGVAVDYAFPEWEVWGEGDTCRSLPAPRHFRHTLSTVVNGLVDCGFMVLRLTEDLVPTAVERPAGTFDHFRSITAPELTIQCVYRGPSAR